MKSRWRWSWQSDLLIAAGLFVYGMALLTRGINLEDQSWTLQLLARIRGGEGLYRDIFYGAMPLAVYLPLLFTRLTGVDIVALNLALALCFAATGLVVLSAARRLNVAAHGRTIVIAAFMVWAAPRTHSFYPALADFFFVTVMVVSLQAKQRGFTAYRLALIGVLVGLCLSTKQNIGALAGVAAGTTFLVHACEQKWPLRRVAGGVLSLAVTAMLPLAVSILPVVLSGAGASFLDYGFINKSTYIDRARMAYGSQLQIMWQWLSHPSPHHLQNGYFYIPYLLPFLVWPLLIRRAILDRGVDARRLSAFRPRASDIHGAGVSHRTDGRIARPHWPTAAGFYQGRDDRSVDLDTVRSALSACRDGEHDDSGGLSVEPHPPFPQRAHACR